MNHKLHICIIRCKWKISLSNSRDLVVTFVGIIFPCHLNKLFYVSNSIIPFIFGLESGKLSDYQFDSIDALCNIVK